MKAIILTFLILICTASSAFAVPNLQLFIPNASYDGSTETWVTYESNFKVWILAANLNHGSIYDISLVAALGDDDPFAGSLTITPEGGSPITYSGSNFLFGTPPLIDPLPSHGVYPASYIEMFVASQTTSGPFVEVQDYVPGGDGGTSLYGQIFKYSVSTTYSNVHFDCYGFYDDPNGKRIFAPFSHDAQKAVPEPGTMLLFGVALAGAGVLRRFRH